MRTLFLLVIAILTSVAHAGDKGNLIGKKGQASHAPSGYLHGGAVVCRNKDTSVKTAYVLEYSELDSLKSSLIQYDSKISDWQYIQSLATILEKEAPAVFQGFRFIGDRLARQADNFMNNRGMQDLGVNFVSQAMFVEANNSKVSKAPKSLDNCSVEQAVIGQKMYNGILFIVQADVYARMSKRDRRGLLLHEALFYSFTRYYGDVDSARTRYVHQRLVQYDLSELTPEVIADILSHSYLDFRI